MCSFPTSHKALLTDAPLKHEAVLSHHIDDENLRQADFCYWPITFARQTPAFGLRPDHRTRSVAVGNAARQYPSCRHVRIGSK